MNLPRYTDRELAEIRRAAAEFSSACLLRLPCLFHGNPVANTASVSKAASFSSQHKIFWTSQDQPVYLVCAYPLAVIHRVLDGLMRLLTGKYCIKPLRLRKWKMAFVGKSLIPTMPTGVLNVVAMPFIPNENFRDILAGLVGNYTLVEKGAMIRQAVVLINDVHEPGVVWGDLLAINMIRSRRDCEVILCNTETVYYWGSLAEQKASDWLDFICSCCGALQRAHPGVESRIVSMILEGIRDEAVRTALKALCQKRVGLLHRLFFSYTRRRLSTALSGYKAIREQIASS